MCLHRSITTHTHPYPSILIHTVDLPCGTPANYCRWSNEFSSTCCPIRTLLSRCRALLSTGLRRRPLPILLSLRRYFLVPLLILMSKHQGHIQDVLTLSQHLPTPVLTSHQLSKTLQNQFIERWPKPLWPSVFQQPRRKCWEATKLDYFLQPTETRCFEFYEYSKL